MRGEYVLIGKNGEELGVVKNTLIGQGHLQMMSAFFNKDAIADWSFVFGAFSEVPAYTDVAVAQYGTEPTIAVNGYQRVTLNPVNWTITAAGDNVIAESPDITFTGSGGSFDKSFNRLFMHLRIEQPAATFTEYLFSISSALPTAKTVVDLEVYTIRYRVYLK